MHAYAHLEPDGIFSAKDEVMHSILFLLPMRGLLLPATQLDWFVQVLNNTSNLYMSWVT